MSCFAFLKLIKQKSSVAQKTIITELGFGFIFHLPSTFHCKYAVFASLLQIYNIPSSCFLPDGGEHIPVNVDQGRLIFGFPIGAKKPTKQNAPTNSSIRSTAAKILSFNHNSETVSMSRAKDVIDQLLGKRMSPVEEQAFRATVLIFVVGSFLAPHYPPGEVDLEILEAIASPEGIHAYDWASYALDYLKGASAHVKEQLRRGCPGTYLDISGCAAYFMVSYLIYT